MDFQRAVQAYIWALPMISMAQWRLVHEEDLGARMDIVYIESYADRIGGLTYNATVPHVLPLHGADEPGWPNRRAPTRLGARGGA